MASISDNALTARIENHPIWEKDGVEEMAVVLAHFNPCGYRLPVTNMLRTLDQLHTLGASVYLAHLAFPTSPHPLTLFRDGVAPSRVAVLKSTTVWFHKEPLLDYAVRHLVPATVEKVLLLDADVLFTSEGPLHRVSSLLDQYPAVHPWSVATYLGPNGQEGLRRVSIGHAISSGMTGASDPRRYRAGFGMALRRSFWSQVGGCHLAPVGGGDTLLCAALTGRWADFEPELTAQSLPSWERYREWAALVSAWSGGQLVGAENEIVHQYHGSPENRRYDDRRDCLAGFNPAIHVAEENSELPGWSDYAKRHEPGLVSAVASHFTMRREDD